MFCVCTQWLLLTNPIRMLTRLIFFGLICFVWSNPAQFEKFKRNFDRKYSSKSEELQRYEIFKTNLATINDHNSREGMSGIDRSCLSSKVSMPNFRRNMEDGCQPVYRHHGKRVQVRQKERKELLLAKNSHWQYSGSQLLARATWGHQACQGQGGALMMTTASAKLEICQLMLTGGRRERCGENDSKSSNKI